MSKISSSPLSSDLTLSIVIPAYNEEKYIRRTLQSLQEQTYKKFELVVVDNCSNDTTAAIAQEFGARIVIEKQKGIGAARRAGFAHAKGDIIATTDADAMIKDKFWLEKIMTAFINDPDLVGYGGVFRLYSGPLTARLAARYGMYPLYWLAKIFSGKWLLIGPNFAVRRSAYLKTSGIDAQMSQGEDVDIAMKLAKFGKVKLVPYLVVYSSGRRFRHGLLSGLRSYGTYWTMKVFLHIDTQKKFEDIRE